MSIFNEILPKIFEISDEYTKNFNNELKAALDVLDEFEKEYLNQRNKEREASQKIINPMTTLQSINEDEDETPQIQAEKPKTNGRISRSKSSQSSSDGSIDKTTKSLKKRSKNEVDGLLSPEVDKRQKRNASVKAQSIISKQVNVNLTQKLRRETSTDKIRSSRSHRRKEDDKENSEPIALVQVKQEKLSIPVEPMDTEYLPVDIEPKQELDEDKDAMPPPLAPVPKPRKDMQKEKSDKSNDEVNSESRRSSRTRKLTHKVDDMPPPPARPQRPTRSKARVKQVDDAEEDAPTETRPKRTRTKKMSARQNAIDNPASDTEKETPSSDAASPMEKPRPKRSRRAPKAAEKLVEKEVNSEIIDVPKEVQKSPERIIFQEEPTPQTKIVISPILMISKEIKEKKIVPKNNLIKSKLDKQHSAEDTLKNKKIANEKPEEEIVQENAKPPEETNPSPVIAKNIDLDKTHVILNKELNATVTIRGNMDQTVVLPNGFYNHDTNTPKDFHVNETVVIETRSSETVSEKPKIMDATVVLERVPIAVNMTEDDSLLTDDNSDVQDRTPPKKEIPKPQPTSAVKEKVQQFEEMASRVTRTKTRAMAKKDEIIDNRTPEDKISKPILSAETLNKMNNLIFNGKTPQVILSASKVTTNTVSSLKSFLPSSTSKITTTTKPKEAVRELVRSDSDDARKKKEAMLQSKREFQKRKREEKMAAAAAAREAAERERRAALEAAARERQERQAHVDRGKLDRLKEVERKKQESARKVAETEERRRAEEQARQQRLLEEQKRAEALRKKQQEEAEATKREDAMMAKEMEKRQKEYLEKQKLKQKMGSMKNYTPSHNYGTPNGLKLPRMEPTYMADGFQYLDSGSDEESQVSRPIPPWSTYKARCEQLKVQTQLKQELVDDFFSVRVHSVDLTEIFPNINCNMLKRTSSAVWRTPPSRLPALKESPS